MSRKSPTMPRTPIASRPRGGFTLLELSIASVVLLIVLGAMVRALTSGSSAFEEGTSVAEADANAQRLLDRIADELRDADFSTFAPPATAPFGSDSLTFNRGRGWAAGALVHGPTQILRSVIDTGELDNGVDDNGNGLIDEKGLVFTLTGSRVTVRLTLERKSETGEIVTRTVETMVTCRN